MARPCMWQRGFPGWGCSDQRAFSSDDARREFAQTRLFGCDISPQACDFAAFTILSMVATAQSRQRQLWRAIRANFVAMDATCQNFSVGKELREMLRIGNGPLRLICNPPYVSAGEEGALADGHPTRALYLPFVEMAWRVAGGPSDANVAGRALALGATDHRIIVAAGLH